MTEQHNTAAAPVQSSYWPIVLAATLSIAVIGLIVHVSIAIAGLALSVIAVIAWFVERFQGPPPIEHAQKERAHVPTLGPGEAEVEMPVEVGRPHGYWGMVWFITTEALFFANLIAAYLYLRLSSPSWPPAGTPPAEMGFVIVNTIILLASGIPAYYAEKAIQRGDRRGLYVGLILAALLGAVFLGGQVYEYMNAGFNMQTNIFGASFFTLTGFHGSHVLVGIGILLFVLIRSLRGHYSEQNNFGVQFAGTYWHFVDAVWIFLFVLLYLVR